MHSSRFRKYGARRGTLSVCSLEQAYYITYEPDLLGRGRCLQKPRAEQDLRDSTTEWVHELIMDYCIRITKRGHVGNDYDVGI